MNNLNRNTYVFYSFIISLQLLIGMIYKIDTLDINVHDTYFVFTGFHFSIFLTIIIGISLLIHFLTSLLKKKINATILFVQLFIIGTSLLIINYGMYSMTITKDQPRNYYEHNDSLLFPNWDINAWMTLSLLALFLSSVFGVFNFFITLLKRPKI